MDVFAVRHLTLGELLSMIAKQIPDNEALIHPVRRVRMTWRQLSAETERLARGLMALGVQRGDRVALWAGNIPQWIVVMFAVARVGAVLVNVNTGYREKELALLLDQSRATWLLLSNGVPGNDFIATVQSCMPELQQPVPLECSAFPALRGVIALEDGNYSGMLPYADVLDMASEISTVELAAREGTLSPWEVANIQYTSGTSGRPKGVMLTHQAMLNNGYWIGHNLHLSPKDRFCLPTPLMHCLGCIIGVLSCINHGATMVLTETCSPSVVLRTLVDERCTALCGVPSLFHAMLRLRELPQCDLSHLRTGVMAGAPCPKALVQESMQRLHLPELSICYGLTEASPIITQTLTQDSLSIRTGSVGRPLPGIDVCIRDPQTGVELPRGETGEICCRGRNVMIGYCSMPKETAETVDAEGWLHTGDLGILDTWGVLHITGRIKDMIIRNGENIYPCEIEDFLRNCDGIEDAQVVAVPSEVHGEEVGAFILTRRDTTLHTGDVRALCNRKIAGYKIPRYVAFVDAFPMTNNGKIRKSVLREQAIHLWVK